MAHRKFAVEENVEGIFYVDATCIDCSTCRHYAPETFGQADVSSYVKKQPINESESLLAKQALLACPVGCIGMREKQELKTARNSFPKPLAESVSINGFNHENSFGAHSYFVEAKAGNWLIDSPRFLPHLVKQFEQRGGLKYIFLTHRDDVSDAHKYAAHFKAERIIHDWDSGAQSDAEIIIKGDQTCMLDQGEILFTPGHTRGHLTLLWDNKYLFTGDHFAWITHLNQFASFRNACWYSWKVQIQSVDKLKVCENVEWVFPGHGKWGQVPLGTFPKIVNNAVEWMKHV